MSSNLAAALANRFQPFTHDTSRGLVLQLSGAPGTGKTDFALRAPGPLFHFGFDFHGARRPATRLMATYPDQMAKVYTKVYPVKPRDRKHEPDAIAQEQMREEVLVPFLEDFEFALDNGARSIVMDTWDGLREIQIVAKFGKLEQNSQTAYQEINAEGARLVQMARQADCVLILVARMKEEYKETLDKKGNMVSKSTGKLIPATSVRTAHTVDASLEMLDAAAPFRLKIVDAKTNKTVSGTILDSPDFMTVGSLLKPDVDLSAWE